MYSKAQGQFEWVAKYSTHNLTLQRSAAETARTIKCYRAGVCPQNCLKANDPRWAPLAGHPPDEKWLRIPYNGGWSAWSEHHIGELITYVKGVPTNVGTCPTCNGTGKVAVLKDGAPIPH